MIETSFTDFLALLPPANLMVTAGERIVGTSNESFENGLGPITTGVGKRLFGSTSDGATVDAQAPPCGSDSSPTAPGVWYTIIGDGGEIAVSTCTGTEFDSQISIFTGGSCDQLTCVDGNNDACGSQSRVDFQSNEGQTYHVLVHGVGGASGTFALSIAFNRLAILFDTFATYNISSQALQDISSPQYAALEWMADIDSSDLQATLSVDELVERFVLVLLHFTTGGASWSDQARFLSPSLNTCSWNNIFDSTIGVGCNGNGSVVRLDLRKFHNSPTCQFLNFAPPRASSV